MIILITYLSNGVCILDNLNEASVWSSGDAPVRDEGKVQSLLLHSCVSESRQLNAIILFLD